MCFPGFPRRCTARSSREVRPVSILHGHTDNITDISWHESQQHLLSSCGRDSAVRVWDTRDNKTSLLIDGAHHGGANCVQFHPVSSFAFASAGEDGIGKLWDLRKTKDPTYRLAYHGRAITSLHWAPFCESVLATGGKDRRVVIWDIERGSAHENYDGEAHAPVEVAFVHIGHLSAITDLRWNEGLDDEWVLASVDSSNCLQYYRPKDRVVNDHIPAEAFDVDYA